MKSVYSEMSCSLHELIHILVQGHACLSFPLHASETPSKRHCEVLNIVRKFYLRTFIYDYSLKSCTLHTLL